MRIVFPEWKNKVIREAAGACPEVEAVSAESLEKACEMLARGEAEAMVAGIDLTTRDVVMACRKQLPMAGKYFSSCFLMQKGEEKLVLADAGVCKNPNAEMLEEIVLQTYDTAKRVLDDEPRVAMLSFSSFGSGGEDETIKKIDETIRRVRKGHPEILIDGEMQLDTAVNEVVASKKAPNNSLVAGRANVLICPDLNAGNILYKGLEQLGGWTAAGPILQGFKKPVADLSRGSTVEDVILVIKVMEKIA